MKIYVSQILVLVATIIVVYIFWGVEIKSFLIDRGVVDISTFFTFLYTSVFWLIAKFFSFVASVGEFVLKIFNNILSNVVRIADLLTGILDILKKISSFIGGIFGTSGA